MKVAKVRDGGTMATVMNGAAAKVMDGATAMRWRESGM
jgi:hypothetical protein